MTALLKRVRHPHVVAHNGAEALEHVARQPIDLIIADLMLPDMHGLDLIEQILVRPHLQDIPVMFCTANADPKTLKRAPARWESWREMIKRLRVDSRTFHPLLMLARDHLAELVQMLGRVKEG